MEGNVLAHSRGAEICNQLAGRTPSGGWSFPCLSLLVPPLLAASLPHRGRSLCIPPAAVFQVPSPSLAMAPSGAPGPVTSVDTLYPSEAASRGPWGTGSGGPPLSHLLQRASTTPGLLEPSILSCWDPLSYYVPLSSPHRWESRATDGPQAFGAQRTPPSGLGAPVPASSNPSPDYRPQPACRESTWGALFSFPDPDDARGCGKPSKAIPQTPAHPGVICLLASNEASAQVGRSPRG